MLIELAIALTTVVPSNEELRQQVICAETGFSQSVERKDKAAFIAYIDPDARFVGGVVGRVDQWIDACGFRSVGRRSRS